MKEDVNYMINFTKNALVDIIDEFRGLPFSTKLFVERRLRELETAYCTLTGKVYDWMTSEDREVRERIDERYIV